MFAEEEKFESVVLPEDEGLIDQNVVYGLDTWFFAWVVLVDRGVIINSALDGAMVMFIHGHIWGLKRKVHRGMYILLIFSWL